MRFSPETTNKLFCESNLHINYFNKFGMLPVVVEVAGIYFLVWHDRTPHSFSFEPFLRYIS